jgi:large subunit ribosomal protein L16
VLQPKRVKYRKTHKGQRRGQAHSGNTLVFGDFGLQAQEAAWLTSRQIEAGRRVIVRYLRRGGQMWIRIFPDKPVTKKPAETRMGSGKGAPDHWVAVVRPGRMLYEVGGIKENMAKEALHLAAYKLPIGTRFVAKETVKEEAKS